MHVIFVIFSTIAFCALGGTEPVNALITFIICVACSALWHSLACHCEYLINEEEWKRKKHACKKSKELQKDKNTRPDKC
jgi:hypothetical protein